MTDPHRGRRSHSSSSSTSAGGAGTDAEGATARHSYEDIPQSPILERDDNGPSYTLDHTYLRSIEGLIRIATIPVAIIFIALDLAGYKGPGEWVNLFVAVSWLLYAIVTITVEVFVPDIYVHRLVDGIVCIVWTGVWGISTIIAISNAAIHNSSLLGGAAFFSIVMMVLIALNAFFAMRTWRTYEGGTKGSQPIFHVTT